MKKHDYLNLKMGDIEEYTMVVKKNDLAYWENLGWLTHTQVGLPKGDEQASLLYGEIEEDEILVFNRPTLVRDVPNEQLHGLHVKGIHSRLGSYGMGGPGFFGLWLNNSHFLNYAVWGAGDYVIIDDRVVECNPAFYHKTKPWLSNYGDGQTWDDLTPHIAESIIQSISFTENNCSIALKKNNKSIEITFVKNDPRLPRKVGRKRNAFNKGVITDYLLLQHENAILIV